MKSPCLLCVATTITKSNLYNVCQKKHFSMQTYVSKDLIHFGSIQWTFSGSNTDRSFTTAVSNSFLSPLVKTTGLQI